MALTAQRQQEIQQMLQQRTGTAPTSVSPQGTGMTPQRQQEIQQMMQQRLQPQEEQGKKGLLGAAIGFGKGLLTEGFQKAQSGINIGQALGESKVGEAFGNFILSPFNEQKKKQIGQTAQQIQGVVEQSAETPEALKPQSKAEQTGATIEDIAEFFVPTGAALGVGTRVAPKLDKFGKFAQPLTRGIEEGVTSAATALGQTGEVGTSVGAGLTDLALSTGLGVVGKGVSKLTRGRRLKLPGAGIDEGVQGALQRTGVSDVPSSVVSKSKLGQIIEQAASKGFAGSQFATKIDDAVKGLNKFASDLVERSGRITSPSEAGQAVVDGLNRFRTDFINKKEELYNLANVSSINARMQPQSTYNIVNEMVRKLQRVKDIGGDVPELAFWQEKLSGLSTKDGAIKSVRIADAIELLKDINRRGSFNDVIATGDRASVNGLAASLADEIDDALTAVRPDMAEALRSANQAYKEGITFMQSSLATRINNLTGQTDKIFDIVRSPATSVEDLRRIFDLAGDQADALRSTFISEAIRKASRDDEIRGTTIETLMRSFGPEKLDVILTPPQLQGLQDLATASNAIQRGQRIAEGSQTAFLTKTIAQVTALFANPLLALQMIAGDAALGKAVFSKQGQKILLEGIDIGQIGQGIDRALEAIGPRLGSVGAAAVTNTNKPSLNLNE